MTRELYEDGRYTELEDTTHYALLEGAIVVVPPTTTPTILTTSLATGMVAAAYSQALAATGTLPITWSSVGAALPAGLSLSGATITGTPTTAGTTTGIILRATNVAGHADTPPLSLLVLPVGAPPPPPTAAPVIVRPLEFPREAPYRFVVEDLSPGSAFGQLLTDDLPLEGWTNDETINRPGALRARLPLTSRFADEQYLDPWRRAIYVLRDERVEWGGLLQPPSLDVGATELAIACFGWPGYWDHRIIRTDYTPTQIDQLAIFAHLIADAQDEAVFGDGFNLGISVVYDAPSGVLRDRVDDYRPWKTKNLGEALRQLAALDDGFDFAMEYSFNAATNRIDKSIRLHYPRMGRDTGFLLEYERGVATNVLARGFADPVTLAWTGDGWGSGTDELRLKVPYIDESKRNVYPPYDDAPSWSEVSVLDTLAENTAAAFARTGSPRRIPVLRVNPDVAPTWDSYGLGDTIGVRIIDGYGSTPGVASELHRITGRSVSGDGTYQLVLDVEDDAG